MKKVITMLAMVLAMAMALTACGSSAQTAPAEGSGTQNAETSAPAESAAEGSAEGSENMGNALAAEEENAADAEVDPYEGQYTVEELSIDDNGTNIYARVYLPLEEQEKYPTVIMSHGIGGTYKNCEPYAR